MSRPDKPDGSWRICVPGTGGRHVMLQEAENSGRPVISEHGISLRPKQGLWEKASTVVWDSYCRLWAWNNTSHHHRRRRESWSVMTLPPSPFPSATPPPATNPPLKTRRSRKSPKKVFERPKTRPRNKTKIPNPKADKHRKPEKSEKTKFRQGPQDP